MAKRGRPAHTSSSPSKKAKGPSCGTKIAQVVAALHDKHVEVPGPAHNRSMLAAAAPKALSEMVDDRHGYQSKMFAMIGEVLRADTTSWEGKVAGAKWYLDESNTEGTRLDTVLADATGRSEAKKNDIKGSKEQLRENKKATSEANSGVHGAESAAADFVAAQAEKTEERSTFNSALTEAVAALKAPAWKDNREKNKMENVHLTKIGALLKQICADASLLDCVPGALRRKPEERGPFDQTVIAQVEEGLSKHIASLDQWLASFDAGKAEKDAAVAAAHATHESATAAQQATADAITKADAESMDIDHEVKIAKHAVKEHAKVTEGKEKAFGKEQHGLDISQGNLDALTFLLERCPPPPEPEPVPEEPVPEPVAMAA